MLWGNQITLSRYYIHKNNTSNASDCIVNDISNYSFKGAYVADSTTT